MRSSNRFHQQGTEGDAPQMGSWRSLASSVGAKVKTISKGGYDTVSSKVAAWRGTEGETWTQWRERRREESKGTEKVALFPGFAVKRHRGQQEPGAFDLDVYVDGYASSLRSPELASRSQKAFMRIAKGFAALPRLPELQGGSEAVNDEPIGDEGQYLDLSSLPPPPDAITEETERLTLEHRYRNTERGQAEPQDDSAVTTLGLSHAELARLHANLDARLQPFWSSILSNRSVRVSLFAKPPPPTQPSDQNPFADPEDDDTDRPLAVQELSTSLQGYFSHRFTIPFEDLCTHPHALDIAFNRDPTNEHPIHVVAELVSAAMTQSVSQTRQSYPKPDTYSTPQNNLGVPTANSKIYSSSIASTSTTSFSLPPVAAIDIPITSAAVRLISDIDDTVKVAEVLKGVKTIFQNVFVKSLEELVIPGMGEWYTSLSQKGVRFHYVSNSPFELLPVLQNFFEIAKLPRGSVRLKFYGGRSLLHGLWEAAGERKRTGVIEILDHFPESRFFLVGDTGEQDLELYSQIAHERPDQILGVFLRDVTSVDLPDLELPPRQFSVGHASKSGSSTSSMSDRISPLTTRQPIATPMMSMNSPNSASSNPPQPPSTPPYQVRRTRRSDSTPPSISNTSPSRHSSIGPSLSDTLTEEPAPMQRADSPLRAPPLPPRSNTMSTGQPLRQRTNDNSPGGALNSERPVASPHPLPGTYFSSNSYMAHRSSTSLSSGTTSEFGRQQPPQRAQVDPVRQAAEKRNYDLQMRVFQARSFIPSHIVFRVFKDPKECVEASEIMDKINAAEMQRLSEHSD